MMSMGDLTTDKGRVFPISKTFLAWPVTCAATVSEREGISIQNTVTVSLKLSNVSTVFSSVLLSAEFVEGFVDSVN